MQGNYLEQQVLHLQNNRLLLVHDLCQYVLNKGINLLVVQIVVL